MRLLYVIDSLAPGGAETSLAEMAPGLLEAGVEIHVLPLVDRLHLAHRLREAGALVHTPASRRGRLRSVSRIVSVIRELDPDLVHTTLYESNIAGRIAAWLTRKPTSSSLVGDTYGDHRAHTLNPLKFQLALALDRVTARYCTHVHAVSTPIAASAARHLHIDPRRVVVIPRGRDPQRFRFRPEVARAEARANLGIDGDSPVILAVGRHEPAKGLMDLLNAAPHLSDEFPDLVFLLAGKDGTASHDLKCRASELKADIRFLGHREDIPELLAAADLLCFPSLSEGSPGTLIEAMAVGCPIVASDIPANLEVLGNPAGDSAWLSAPHKPVLLADAMRTALLDGGNRKVHSARSRFEAEFQISSVTKRMVKFFAEAAGQATPEGD